MEIVNILETEPYLVVEARLTSSNFRMTQKLQALMRTSRSLFESCVELNDSIPEEAHLFSINIDDPGWLADMIATSLSLPNEIRKTLMVLAHPAERLRKVKMTCLPRLLVVTSVTSTLAQETSWTSFQLAVAAPAQPAAVVTMARAW